MENANGVIKKLTSAERSYYTAAEVREMMGVSRDTAYRMIRCCQGNHLVFIFCLSAQHTVTTEFFIDFLASFSNLQFLRIIPAHILLTNYRNQAVFHKYRYPVVISFCNDSLDPFEFRNHFLFPVSCLGTDDYPVHLSEHYVMLRCNVTHQRFNADKCVTERWKIIESVSICVTSNCSSMEC